MATLTVSGQVLLHAHPINMHNFLLSRVFQSDRFKAKFSDFFGDQIAFQAGYFETDHDGYGIYVLPLIIYLFLPKTKLGAKHGGRPSIVPRIIVQEYCAL